MSSGEQMEKIRITDLHQPVQTKAFHALSTELAPMDIDLSKGALLRFAEEQSDVPIDIDPGLVERFTSVFEESLTTADVHQVGRFFYQQAAINGIIQMSRMNALRKANPEISAAPVNPPLVVAGMPRSGTTYLLQLLASEPGFTSVTKWECNTPFPPQSVLCGEEEDKRKEEGFAANDFILSIAPYRQQIYDVGADEHTEEIEFMIHAGHTVAMSFFGDVPRHDEAFYASDQTESYETLRAFMQTISWLKQSDPSERWLLKSPHHMSGLPALDKVFPEAKLVFTHRDPASVFISLLTLIGYAGRQFYSSISKQQVIDRALRMQHGFLRGLCANADRFEGRSTHIYFSEFMQDYHASLEKVFDLLGRPYSDERRAMVEKAANSHKRGRTGARIVYDMEEDFGLTRDDIRKEFSYYLDQFPVAIEESNQ